MKVARLAEIHRYPVKSMLGERIESVRVAADGLRGDRIWATRDEQRGGIEGARRLPELLGCTARFTAPVADSGPLPIPVIELPDGTTLAADDPEVAAKLTKLTGRELTFWDRRPADDTAHYKRGKGDHADMQTELMAIFARIPGEPLPDLSVFPRESMLSATIPGTYYDAFPLFVVTRTSLETLAKARPESRFDALRFRPSLILDSEETTGFPENAWVGKQVRIGEVEISITAECPRCIMTTHPVGDLPKDPGVMRALVKENNGNVGVYAAVTTPGVVREGDSVEVIS